jgi:hypothetical protein
MSPTWDMAACLWTQGRHRKIRVENVYNSHRVQCSHACVSTDRVRFLFSLDSLLWFQEVYLAVQTNLHKKSVERERIFFFSVEGKERTHFFPMCWSENWLLCYYKIML